MEKFVQVHFIIIVVIVITIIEYFTYALYKLYIISANWKKGDPTIVPDQEKAKAYFTKLK